MTSERDENPFGDPEESFANVAKDSPTTVVDVSNSETVVKNLAATPTRKQIPSEVIQSIEKEYSDANASNSTSNTNNEQRPASVELLNLRINNWPPLPDFCCWQPCFYHDINVDIRPEFQTIVTQLYHLWLMHTAMLLINVIGSATLWIFIDESEKFFAAIFNALIWPTLSFCCWYRPIYKAFRSDSSFNFMLFFGSFCAQIAISCIQTLGLSGYCGFITAFKVLATGPKLLSAWIFLIASGFCLLTISDFFMINKVSLIYRSTGASMERAREEFANELMNNQKVRNLATNAVVATVQSQLRPNRY